jgi:hypothetical protein
MTEAAAGSDEATLPPRWRAAQCQSGLQSDDDAKALARALGPASSTTHHYHQVNNKKKLTLWFLPDSTGVRILEN